VIPFRLVRIREPRSTDVARRHAWLASIDASGKAAEAISKYIITDMYAKAVQGMAPEDAVAWAHAELV
jgi:hypothetical protein